MSKFMSVYEPTEEGAGRRILSLGSLFSFTVGVISMLLLPFTLKYSIIGMMFGFVTADLLSGIIGLLDKKYARAMEAYLKKPDVQTKIANQCQDIIKRFKKPSGFKSFQFKMSPAEIPDILDAGVDVDFEWRNSDTGKRGAYMSNEYLIGDAFKVTAIGDDSVIAIIAFTFIVELKNGKYRLYYRTLNLDTPIKI